MALFQINIDDEFVNTVRLEYYRGEIALNEWINCAVIFDETKIRQPRPEDNPKGIYNFEADVVYSRTNGGIDIDANITFTVEILSTINDQHFRMMVNRINSKKILGSSYLHGIL
jgi:hypothetical protein